MPIIYGNPGTGRNHRTEQPAYDGNQKAAPPKKKRGRPKKVIVRSDGKRYPTSSDAALDVAGRAANIRNACRGIQSTAYGYGWRYEEEMNDGKAE